MTFDASGSLKLSKRDQVEPCSASNEIQIRYCLIRRGLALDQGNVMDYKLHDRLAEKLLNSRMEEPPAGCVKVSLKQMENADKKFWTLLSEKTRDGIKSGADGRPCDKHFDACFNSPEFLKLLQHRFGPGSSGGGAAKNQDHEEPKLKKVRTNPKGGGKGSFMRIPNDLLAIGCVGQTAKGHRLCFDFNLKKCKLHVKGQRCSKGLHLCGVKGCQKNHAALDCPNKGSE